MRNFIKVFCLSLAIVMAVFSFATADVSLDVPFYSQVDPSWSADEMMQGETIGETGCMITSFSMALKYYGVNTNPGIFNEWLKANQGYIPNEGLDRSKPAEYANKEGVNVIVGSLITGQNYQAIHNELESGYPVIVKVPLGIYGHWMLVIEETNGQFYCWDPIDSPAIATKRSINKYGPYLKYLTIRGPVHHQVFKFSDSPTVYLKSNSRLWRIASEQDYAKLGFSYDCNFSADWDYVINLDPSQRGNYIIRQEKIPSQNVGWLNYYIAYKVVPKVGPVSCVSMAIDESKIYSFGGDNKFHHIVSEQVYYDLGYNPDWSDVVEISPDLFMHYGEGDEIDSAYGSGIYEPENLIAQAISSSQINLVWDRGLNPPEYENLRYRIYRYGTEIATTANTNYSDSGLNPETQYCYKITAHIDGSDESDYSNQACAATADSANLAAPTGLSAEPMSESEIYIDWNPVAGADGYKIYRSNEYNGEYYFIGLSASIDYYDAGLPPSACRCYRIKAYSGNAVSDYSGQACATTHSNDPPAAVIGLDLKY